MITDCSSNRRRSRPSPIGLFPSSPDPETIGGHLDRDYGCRLITPSRQARLGSSVEGGAYEWIGRTVNALGEGKGLAYMRELAKPTELRTGRTLIAQLVAAAEFKGGLSGYSQTFEVLKPVGAPVDWMYLPPVFANIHPSGIAVKAPHPNAARWFIDFVCIPSAARK